MWLTKKRDTGTLLTPLHSKKLKMKNLLSIVLITSIAELNNTGMAKERDKTSIIISVGSKDFTGFLFKNPTSNSLMEQMPFTVELKDYASTEKIFYPEKKLSVESAPKGYDPSVGDITCYGPWGNIAIFYENHGYADGLILLGQVDDVIGMVKTVEATKSKVVFNIKN